MRLSPQRELQRKMRKVSPSGSTICTVRRAMRREQAMSVYTSSSVACTSKPDTLPRSTARTGKCWREAALPVVAATPRITLLSHEQSCLFFLCARAGEEKDEPGRGSQTGDECHPTPHIRKQINLHSNVQCDLAQHIYQLPIKHKAMFTTRSMR